jgi:hypothetical protein
LFSQVNFPETNPLNNPEMAKVPRPAASPIERAILGIWKSALGQITFGIDDDFFELGGNSDLAEQVAEEIRDIFSIDIATDLLFNQPCIAQQAVCIEKHRRNHSVFSIPQVVRQQYYPLSYSQQRIWFYAQLEPGSALYNSTISIEITGSFEVGVFIRVIQEIVKRHEALRTVFRMVNGKPFQVILPDIPVSVQCSDLRGLSRHEQNRELSRFTIEEAQSPFDLTQGPLIRARVLQIKNDQFGLLLSIHHIASDGWSFGVLMKEIEGLYTAFQSGKPSPLKDLAVQYVDFCSWQNLRLQGEYLDSLVSYWQAKLHDIPLEINLPTDFPRPANFSFRGAGYSFLLPKDLVLALKSLCQHEAVTLYMVLLAGFQFLLRGYSGQNDFGIGTPIANRTRAELEPIIGLFINMLVIRTTISGNLSFHDYLQQVKATLLEAYAHQDLNFELLVEKLHPRRLANRSPFFQIMFILENLSLSIFQLPGIQTRINEIETATSKYDLSLYIFEHKQDDLTCKIEYATDLFKRETIQQMGAHYRLILEEIVTHPERSILDIGKDLFSEFAQSRKGVTSALIKPDREDFDL